MNVLGNVSSLRVVALHVGEHAVDDETRICASITCCRWLAPRFSPCRDEAHILHLRRELFLDRVL